MADEALAKAGLHFDELNKIRVLEPEVAQQTRELKEECKDFVDSESNSYSLLKHDWCTATLYTESERENIEQVHLMLFIHAVIIMKFLSFSEIGEFQKIVGTFIEMVDNVAKEVEKEKMKVGGFDRHIC